MLLFTSIQPVNGLNLGLTGTLTSLLCREGLSKQDIEVDGLTLQLP